MEVLQYFAAGAFAVGFLILIHEAGHWAAARSLGIAVPIFSIGFGPRLFGFRVGETDVRVSLLPFGGYAFIAGGDQFAEDSPDAPPEAYSPEGSIAGRPVWQRLFVHGAGPGVNLIAPYFMFIGVLLYGGLPELGNQTGEILPGSVAAQAGLLTGDTVVAVDDVSVDYWYDLQEQLDKRIGHDAPTLLTVERDGARSTHTLPAGAIQADLDGSADLEALGIEAALFTARIGVESSTSPAGLAGVRTGDRITAVDGVAVDTWNGLLAALSGTQHQLTVERATAPDSDNELKASPPTQTVSLEISRAAGDYASPTPVYANPWGLVPAVVMVQLVTPDSAAEGAGLLPGDRLAGADGAQIWTFSQLILITRGTSVNGGPPREMGLDVVREGELLSFRVTPRLQVIDGREIKARPLAGLQNFSDVGRYMPTKVRPFTLMEASSRAGQTVYTQISTQFAILRNLITGASSVEKNLGGPVAMFVAAGQTASMGIAYYVTLIAAMSIGLGVVNLLPVPVFDGGRIVFDLIEAVRGRPVSLEIREKTMIASIVAVILLMVYVTRNDVMRVFDTYFT